jgi:hypothetical protein
VKNFGDLKNQGGGFTKKSAKYSENYSWEAVKARNTRV